MLARSQHSWAPLFAAILTIALWNVALAEQTPGIFQDTRSLPVSNDLELLKEEETVSIASRYEQPISQAPSNVYVVTDGTFDSQGATDLPTVLRRIPGLEVMQMTGADFNVSAGRQSTVREQDADHGRRTFDLSRCAGETSLEIRPVTLPEIKRIRSAQGARIRHVWI